MRLPTARAWTSSGDRRAPSGNPGGDDHRHGNRGSWRWKRSRPAPSISSKPVDLNVLRGTGPPGAGAGHQPKPEQTRHRAAATGDRLGGDPQPTGPAPHHRPGRAQPGAGATSPANRARGKGTGRAHHPRRKRRAAGPFVPVNCARSRPELMESEFFGHKKGSFTGAHADKPACSRPPRAEPCSSTKSPNCRCRCR